MRTRSLHVGLLARMLLLFFAVFTLMPSMAQGEQTSGDGWNAYADFSTGDSKCVHLNGSAMHVVSPQQASEHPIRYSNPVWSHDGSMLAFNGPTTDDVYDLPHRRIYLFREGKVKKLPGTETCTKPAFTGDNARILSVCAPVDRYQDLTTIFAPTDVPALGVYFAENSWWGTIQSSSVDSGSPSMEITWDRVQGNPDWNLQPADLLVRDFKVSSIDGSIMLTVRDEAMPPGQVGTLLFTSDFQFIDMWRLGNGITASTILNGQIVRTEVCRDLCNGGYYFQFRTSEGKLHDDPMAASIWADSWTFDLSPDGSRAVAWKYPDGLWVQDLAGNRVPIDVSGSLPVWQPVTFEILEPR